MDTVQVVNNYMQSGDMRIFQFWQGLTNFFIVLFAGMMWWNARAVKKLEQTNLKIAIWQEIKQFTATMKNYVTDVVEGAFLKSPSLYVDYVKEFRYTRFYFQDDDVVLTHLSKLVIIGEDLMSMWKDHNDSVSSAEFGDLNTVEFHNMVKNLTDEVDKIDQILIDRFNLSFPTEKS